MSASIFHGAPGSFKSASAFWFEVLPALRSGRVVVTNIEGILPKESIEIELNETFPEGADIWRLSSQTDTGLYLWRRWFWWMPVKAFIILDEIQDVFPDDAKVFRPEDLDSEGIECLKDKLPTKYYDYYWEEIGKFTPEVDEASVDDTGQTILDEKGNIIYPKTMREANMRHRKYNWDLIYCTPAIEEIHKLIRRVCEFAYFYKYNQALEFIPYFFRKPRFHEHSPKTNGTRKKDDVIKWRRVPVEVHKCYRSTSTGGITKRGGVNAFKDPTLIFAIALLFFCFSYATWYLFIKEEREVLMQQNLENNKKYSKVSSEADVQDTSFFDDPNSLQVNNEKPVSLVLPYDSTNIYMTGYQTVFLNKDRKYKEYFFELSKGEQKILMNSNDLYYFGINVEFVNECTVKLIDDDLTKLVRCSPKFANNIKSDYVDDSVSL